MAVLNARPNFSRFNEFGSSCYPSWTTRSGYETKAGAEVAGVGGGAATASFIRYGRRRDEVTTPKRGSPSATRPGNRTRRRWRFDSTDFNRLLMATNAPKSLLFRPKRIGNDATLERPKSPLLGVG